MRWRGTLFKVRSWWDLLRVRSQSRSFHAYCIYNRSTSGWDHDHDHDLMTPDSEYMNNASTGIQPPNDVPFHNISGGGASTSRPPSHMLEDTAHSPSLRNGQLPLSLESSAWDLDLFTGMQDLIGTCASAHSFLWAFPESDVFPEPVVYNGHLDEIGGSEGFRNISYASAGLEGPDKDVDQFHVQPTRSQTSSICLELPILQLDDLNIAATEVYGHIDTIPEEGFKAIESFYFAEREGTSHFVTIQVFHAFLELYFEHFDAQFPLLHRSIQQMQHVTWVLLLALAAAGSHYSEIQPAPLVSRAL
ncbi:hypothetical protein CC86DRAFT_61307 [Ophiobolus disseminans]|uniref:Transcription factor domain-containing protein n=1 Tax=Ophiobolus disseminans TaxID=1469910 RepID=A0A6A6ZU62_9PLEO|nr:hypothetical protein CC86DRAFT_61307 [Ophiobolus disseminans]